MPSQNPARSPARSAGFTLVELLIVVAIIAILASIAIPNFLEAQVRSKVSRAQEDLRTLATGLEAYAGDWTKYPPTPMDYLSNRFLRLKFLTTPVAYLSSIPFEVFVRDKKDVYPYWSPKLNDAMKFSPIYFYVPEEKARQNRWALFSRGPDMDYEMAIEEGGSGLLMYYDPTNGTNSKGDLMRFGP